VTFTGAGGFLLQRFSCRLAVEVALANASDDEEARLCVGSVDGREEEDSPSIRGSERFACADVAAEELLFVSDSAAAAASAAAVAAAAAAAVAFFLACCLSQISYSFWK
jgi:hypothetical protein